MRLLVIADIEDLRWEHGVGEADILLSCGDVSDHVIMEAADAFKCHAIFAVKGNHDPRGNLGGGSPREDPPPRARERRGSNHAGHASLDATAPPTIHPHGPL